MLSVLNELDSSQVRDVVLRGEAMAYFLHGAHLQGIMLALFSKQNIQSKMINTTSMIPCKHVS